MANAFVRLGKHHFIAPYLIFFMCFLLVSANFIDMLNIITRIIIAIYIKSRIFMTPSQTGHMSNFIFRIEF